MAITKVLARDWKKQVKSGGNYLEIKGVNSFTMSVSKSDADTTDFESQGWAEHLPTMRGMTFTLEGFYLESPSGTATAAYLRTNLLGTDNDIYYVLAATGTAGNSVRIRYVVSGTSTPLSVSLSGNDVTVNVATDAGGLATSTAAQVWTAVNAAADPTAGALTATFPDGTGTGVVTAMDWTYLTGGTANGGARDAGQARCEALGRLVGPTAIGDFRLITPGGTRWDFQGSVQIEGPGGDHQAAANWQCTVTVTGQVTVT